MRFSKISLLLAIAFLFSGCEKKNESFQIPPVPVSVTVIEPKTIPADFEYIGVAESSHIVEIRARVEGYLEKIAYQEGSLVKTDDLLFIIDQRPFIAALDAAKGTLEKQEALLWNAQQSKHRMVPLYEQNAVSQRDYDNAIALELASEANVATAKANVKDAALNLSFTSIRAPVTGMVSRAKFREGALISPGKHNLLTTLYVIDPIWVNFSISSGDLLKAREEIKDGFLKYPENMNFSIEVIFADNTTLPATGRINFISPSLQQDTGTMNVRASLPNPNSLILPGQFIRVKIKGATRPNAIIVPQKSVIQGNDGMFVFVVDKNARAQKRIVKPGDWYLDYWIIFSGLEEGDKVIVDGVNKVRNDTPVMITNVITPNQIKKISQETAKLFSNYYYRKIKEAIFPYKKIDSSSENIVDHFSKDRKTCSKKM